MKNLLAILFIVSLPTHADQVLFNVGAGWEILDDNWGVESAIVTLELEWQNDWCHCSVAYEHKSLLTEGWPFNQRGEVTIDELRIFKSLQLFSF